MPRDLPLEAQVDLEVADRRLQPGDLDRPLLLADLRGEEAFDRLPGSDRRDDDRRPELFSRARADADSGSILDQDRADRSGRTGTAACRLDHGHEALRDCRCTADGIARAVEVVPHDGRVNAEARLLGCPSEGAPLCRQDRGEPRVADVLGDDLTGRATTPALDLRPVPPAVRGAERLGHRSLAGRETHGRLAPTAGLRSRPPLPWRGPGTGP